MSFFDRFVSDELVGAFIVERSNRDRGYEFITWQYPDIDPPSRLAQVVQSRTSFSTPVFSRHKGIWHYSFPVSEGLPSSTLPNTSAFAVVVLSRVFCPESFLGLAQTLGAVFSATGRPPRVLEAWMAAFLRNNIPAAVVAGAPGWASKAYDHGALLADCCGLKPLLSSLGVEAILVWTALLLKKRIAVYGDSFDAVSRAVRLLPHLVRHRRVTTVDRTGVTTGADAVVKAEAGVPLFPLVTLAYPWAGDLAVAGAAAAPAPLHEHVRRDVEAGLAAQLAELSGSDAAEAAASAAMAAAGGDASAASSEAAAAAAAAAAAQARPKHYVAGFTDAAIASHRGLWDVCVDLVGGTVAISDEASGDLTMTPLHKDVAKALIAATADEEASDEGVAEVISGKTTGIIESLREIFPDGVAADADSLSAFHAALTERGHSEPVQRFLWNVALAELSGGR